MILYNKCIYKWNYSDLYVIPLKNIRSSKFKGTRIRLLIVKNDTGKPYKEGQLLHFGDSIDHFKSIKKAKIEFCKNYKPYIWEGGLFITKSGLFIINESINKNTCSLKFFDDHGCGAISIVEMSLSEIIPFGIEKVLPEECLYTPDIIYNRNGLYNLVKDNRYYLSYKKEFNLLLYILKHKLHVNNMVAFKDGCCNIFPS